MAIKTFLRVTKTDKKDANGLYILKLARCVKGDDWREIDSVEVVSGQPHRQWFLLGKDPDSFSGNMAPAPEGYYWLAKPTWKGKKFDWSSVYSSGLGPVWIGMRKLNVKQTKRDSFGIHLDQNASTAPGSAGCIVTPHKSVIEKIVAWWEDKTYSAPEFITVNWGLKSVDSGNGSLSQLPRHKPSPGEVVKPKVEVPAKKQDSASGVDVPTSFKLPWYLSLAKPLIIKGVRMAAAALLAMLAGHLPFLAPVVDSIVMFIVQIADKML